MLLGHDRRRRQAENPGPFRDLGMERFGHSSGDTTLSGVWRNTIGRRPCSSHRTTASIHGPQYAGFAAASVWPMKRTIGCSPVATARTGCRFLLPGVDLFGRLPWSVEHRTAVENHSVGAVGVEQIVERSFRITAGMEGQVAHLDRPPKRRRGVGQEVAEHGQVPGPERRR